MSSNIYQGLQSCLMEPPVLSLNSNPSPPPRPPSDQHSDLSAIHSDPSIETHLKIMEIAGAGDGDGDFPADDEVTMNGGVGGWSFLQALSCIYVSPPAKDCSPAMALSGKSLDMCTESLGSETGSDGSEFGGDEKMSLFSSDETALSPSSNSLEKPPPFSRFRSRKLPKPSYPPLLTSMSGEMGVKVKPYREGGRLVLEAVSIPSAKPCFEVERGGGRLRLRLMKHCLLNNNVEEEEEVEEGEEKSGGRRRKGWRRCKEGGGGRKELVNWEPFLVST